MNATYTVATMFECDEIKVGLESFRPDPVWRTTALGCKLLELLQEMFQFEMNYVAGNRLWEPSNNGTDSTYESPPDIYARPLSLQPDSFDYSSPIQAIIERRYGFMLRRIDSPKIRAFFSLPFVGFTWFCLLLTTLIISLMMYVLCLWEKRVIGPWYQEYSFIYELLVIFGACCQHIPPVNPILASRRMAYLTFFCFSYVVYSFYTSNLLSHLVNDRDDDMTLNQLVDSDYSFITLDSIQLNMNRSSHARALIPSVRKKDRLKKKIRNMRYVSISEGLEAVAHHRAALLSDYITLYPYMRDGALDNQAICDLVEINLFSNIKEYLFTSKTFPLKEQFKVGVLRIKETGILKRVKRDNIYSAPQCQIGTEPQASIQHIVVPLMMLVCTAAASTAILAAEIAYYQRNRLWPYVE